MCAHIENGNLKECLMGVTGKVNGGTTLIQIFYF